MGNSSSICADKKLKYFSNTNGSNNTSKDGAELLSVINSPRQETEYTIERLTADILTQDSGIIIENKSTEISNFSQNNNLTHALTDTTPYICNNTDEIGNMPKTIDCKNLYGKEMSQKIFVKNNDNNVSKLNEAIRVGYCIDNKNKGVNNNLTMDSIGQRATNPDKTIAGYMTGYQRLHHGNVNKGLCFSIQERQLLGIHGLLPAVVKTEEQELEQCTILLNRYEKDLDKYIFLISLLDRNERLFYRLIASDVAKMMPLVYTPTVGEACQKYSLIYQYPKGLFITIHDKGHVYDILKNWPEDDVRAIVVTDGERILGLGDLGANGMGIPVGKLALYTALAGVKPNQCLPITLDVGTNTESILNDPLYIGCRHKRVEGQEYNDFIDEFMKAVVRRFGQNCLIQFEDFANKNAFRLLEKYRYDYCTFNDDIQGTAAVAVAGIMSSLRLTNTQLSDNRILFYGAGEAALGIAALTLMGIKSEKILSDQDAKERIWLVDSKGLIVKDRPKGGITGHKEEWAHDYEPIDNLIDVIRTLRPTILIGAAAQPKAFSKEIIEMMAELNENPVIFALSNPTEKAECTAEEAYTYSNGKCIFASGSPFAPVTVNGRTFEPGQGNNSYIFPGIGLGVICSGAQTIPEEMFLLTAKTLASIVKESDLDVGRLYPKLCTIKEVSIEIATVLVGYAYANKLATVRPEPKNKEEFVRAQMYDLNYQAALPNVYPWPKL